MTPDLLLIVAAAGLAAALILLILFYCYDVVVEGQRLRQMESDIAWLKERERFLTARDNLDRPFHSNKLPHTQSPWRNA